MEHDSELRGRAYWLLYQRVGTKPQTGRVSQNDEALLSATLHFPRMGCDMDRPSWLQRQRRDYRIVSRFRPPRDETTEWTIEERWQHEQEWRSTRQRLGLSYAR